MPKMSSSAPVRILLTGGTGFLGKVVLHELIRQRKQLSIDTIYLVIRSKKGQSAEERFLQQIIKSPCFDAFPKDWHAIVRVVSGYLTENNCGISADATIELQKELTHVVHCAASVDFNLPLKDAADANITSALNVLTLAKQCARSIKMVSVSTAYVTPHTSDKDPVFEELSKLPISAQTIYEQILEGTADEKTLLALTSHPNTYTFTKCVAEHLLLTERGDVSLQIVRPSIISASLRYPRPGWIDSAAAFAGFVALIGSGYLRVVLGQKDTRLDVVPCDEVAKRIIERALDPNESAEKISYAVAGLNNCYRIDECCKKILEFFERNPSSQKARLRYVGGRNFRYYAEEWRNHRLPFWIAEQWYSLRRDHQTLRSMRRLKSRLKTVNELFAYFTHNTFDFRSSTAIDQEFDMGSYVELICEGVHRHLLRNGNAKN